MMMMVLILGLMGGSVMAAEESVPVPEKQKASLVDRFIISTFPSPPEELLNLTNLKTMKDAGIDVLVPAMVDVNANNKILELADLVGLEVILWDQRLLPYVKSATETIEPEVIRAVVTDYRNSPALVAYAIADEPNLRMFSRLTQVCRSIEKFDPDHLSLINLFPGYATPAQLGTASFEEYLRTFVEQVHPQILSYDHYPIRYDGSDSHWFDDLQVARKVALEARIPLWLCVQSEGIRDYLRPPTPVEVLWQVNTALAYGVRGFLWFTFWAPPPAAAFPGGMVEHHFDTPFDATGNTTVMFDAVKTANEFIKPVGTELLDWTSVEVVRLSPDAKVESVYPWIKLEGENLQVVAGFFCKGDKGRMVLASDSLEQTQFFSLIPLSPDSQIDIPAAIRADFRGGTTVMLEPGGCLVLELDLPAEIH
jgi:hypothetical protein